MLISCTCVFLPFLTHKFASASMHDDPVPSIICSTCERDFVQESDCLAVDDWQPQHIARYLFHLKRGDEHRKWLLKDIQFKMSIRTRSTMSKSMIRRASSSIYKENKDQKRQICPEIRDTCDSRLTETRQSMMTGGRRRRWFL
jgi:hypothetical protein